MGVVESIPSLGLAGLEGCAIRVEAGLIRGMPSFDIVGLPDAAVRESRDRVRSVLAGLGLAFPLGRLVVNLAPADLKKSGPLYDLPILLALLRLSGSVPPLPKGAAFVGELSLTGEVRPVAGALSMALAAREAGLESLYLPAANAAEGAVVQELTVYPVDHVSGLLEHLTGRAPLPPALPADAPPPHGESGLPDFSEVRGQQNAKRALEVAAAGGHNLLMIGPPGTGKSMLAKRLPSILPPLDRAEAIETTRVHSVAGLLPAGASLVSGRPFRAPHHSASPAGLIGGGPGLRPGELALAHNGVLFLDELPEFDKRALEALRQPLEDGQLTIARAAGRVRYPCSAMVVAAMNPCPCGYHGHPTRPCRCSEGKIALYLGRVSGPLLDRLDLHVDVLPVEYDALASDRPAEPSSAVGERVAAARRLQAARYRGRGFACNARLTPALLREFCVLSSDARELLRAAFDRMGLSGRSYDRILKVSRTLADLDGSDRLEAEHLAEAIQYRGLDAKYWERKNHIL